MGPSIRSGTQIGAPDRGKETTSRPASGRVCEASGCSTILSTYNKSETCGIHTDPVFRHPLARA